MRFQLTVLAAMASIVFLLPAAAEACSCGGTASLPVALEGADVIFVGTVVRSQRFASWTRENPDGSIRAEGQTIAPTTLFNVNRVLRGDAIAQLTIAGDGTTCDVAFERGQTWLVYAQVGDGRVTTSKCSRTRLRAEAGQDINFLEGRLQGRALGVVCGEILRRVAGSGELAAGPPHQTLTIIAAGAPGRFEVVVTRWGPYDLVLPPGEFDIWVERAGRVVADRTPATVNEWSAHRLVLVVEHN